MVLSRRNVAVVVAEAMGTAVLTLSILAISRSAIGLPYFVAIGVGLAMAILVMTVGPTSGAHVNPAVTVGLWTVRKISTLRAFAYIVAQFAGAALAYSLYNYMVVSKMPAAPEIKFAWPVLVAEVVGTLLFTFGVAAAVFQKYEGGRKAAVIGGSLALGIIIAGIASNGILNPAAALGVQSWSKAYVAGPLIGGIIGMNLFVLLFADQQSLRALAQPIRVASPQKSKVTSSKKTTKKKK